MNSEKETGKLSELQIEVGHLVKLVAKSGEHTEEIRGLVGEALERQRQVITFHLARSLQRCLASAGAVPVDNIDESRDSWTRIESLSQLRAAVGGRFKNLKEKWISAGFPLREHRGDREGKAAVVPEGWTDLALWINKQGFDVRLASESDPWLFEVRKL